MARLIAAVVRRELVLGWRARVMVLGSLLFFVLAASLFPLAVGPEPALLRALAPGVLWVCALFAALLSSGQMFGPDWASGALAQMLVSPQPLFAIVFGKVTAHWLANGLALALLSPLVALQYGLEWPAALRLGAALLLGTPLLSLIGATGAALTLGVRGGGVLLALLVLPLEVPVLVFGVGAAGDAASWSRANFALLGAALCAATWLGPWASAGALRIAME